MGSRFTKTALVLVLSFLFIIFTGFQQTHALDKSRFFVCLMFLSGLGSSFAGAVIQSQANETYDQYLHTAVQAEMDKHIDEYDQQNRNSIIASRTGVGLVIGAVILSLIDASNIPTSESQEPPVLFGNNLNFFSDKATHDYMANRGILFSISQRF
jgi:hypothetical protein